MCALLQESLYFSENFKDPFHAPVFIAIEQVLSKYGNKKQGEQSGSGQGEESGSGRALN